MKCLAGMNEQKGERRKSWSKGCKENGGSKETVKQWGIKKSSRKVINWRKGREKMSRSEGVKCCDIFTVEFSHNFSELLPRNAI